MTRVAKTPSFPFYGKDAYDDEAFGRLSFAEQGLYLFLAWWQWQEGSIPAELDEVLDKMPRRKTAEARRLWSTLQSWFPIVDGGRRRNPSVEERRVKLIGDRDRHKAGADITNAKRWGSESLSESLSDTKSESPRAASASESATANAKTSPPASVINPDFEGAKRIVDAFNPTHQPNPQLAILWIEKLGSAQAVLEVVWKYPNKGPDYINKAIDSAMRERVRNARADNATGTDRRTTPAATGSSAATSIPAITGRKAAAD